MKKALVCLLLFAFSSSYSQTFSLTDTQFKVGCYYLSHNIMFDLGKVTLRPECYPNLDSVITFLNTNSTIKLEVGVHSDSRARTTGCGGNLTMSRSKSIADYMVSKGIDASRLIIIGYGGVKPIISDVAISKLKTPEEKEAAYQKNRRVEFKIIAI